MVLSQISYIYNFFGIIPKYSGIILDASVKFSNPKNILLKNVNKCPKNYLLINIINLFAVLLNWYDMK